LTLSAQFLLEGEFRSVGGAFRAIFQTPHRPKPAGLPGSARWIELRALAVTVGLTALEAFERTTQTVQGDPFDSTTAN